MSATTEIEGQEAATDLWASGIVRLPLLDVDETTVGRVVDLILNRPYGGPPRVVGFVALVDRRRIFVHVNRVASIDHDGVRLRGGTVDLRRFRLRAGEQMVERDIVGASVADGSVADVSIRRGRESGRTVWYLAEVAVAQRSGALRRRRPLRRISWDEMGELFDLSAVDRHAARLFALHKADAADRLRALPPDRRAQMVEAIDVERLADLLEELPESEQVKIVESLSPERIADIIDEMEPDDAVDLLKELPGRSRALVLAELPDEVARDLEPLLAYDEATAGGMMTPAPIVVGPGTTVAETLARMRILDSAPALSARVFVTEAPHDVPSGPFLGTVGFQRLLREPPDREVGELLAEHTPTLRADAGEGAVIRLLARYDLLAMPVLDTDRRLVGVVTVDDVLARIVERGTGL